MIFKMRKNCFFKPIEKKEKGFMNKILNFFYGKKNGKKIDVKRIIHFLLRKDFFFFSLNFLKNRNFCILGIFLFLIIMSPASFAASHISLSESQIEMGESVNLVFNSDQPLSSVPDLNSIQSFVRIGAQQQVMNTSVINGKVTQTYQLIFNLFPIKEGEFQIGPFDVEGEQTQALRLRVVKGDLLPATGTNEVGKKGIFSIEASLSADKIYEGETAFYRIRVEESVGLINANLQTPVQKGLTITPVGENSVSQSVKDNQKINVFERSFIITPAEAGTFQISGAQLFGFIPDTRWRTQQTSPLSRFLGDDFFLDAFAPSQKEVYLQSNPVNLTVLPKPSDWKGWWLPSTEVTLTEDYKIPEHLRVGEPIERNVVLSVKGVESERLPLLTQPASIDFKMYANPEQRHTDIISNQLVGTQNITFVLMPTRAGKLKIPAITVPWFDTQTAQKRIAILPEKEIEILPQNNQAAGGNIQPLSPTFPSPEENINSLSQQTTAIPGESKDVVQESEKSKWKAFILSTYGALGWFELLLGFIVIAIAFLAIYLRVRIRRPKLLVPPKTPSQKKKSKPLPDLYPF